MADGNNANDRQWSEAMRRLFDAKHYASPRLLAALDLPGASELLDAASGAEPSVTRGQRVKALTAAMYVDPAGAFDLAAQTLADGSIDPSLRAVAAELIGRSSLDGAEETLIRGLETSDDVVRRAVVSALARAGGPDAFDALSDADLTEGPLSRLVELTQGIIAYRSGLDTDPLPSIDVDRLPTPEEVGELIEISVLSLDGARIASCLESLEESTYSLSVSRERAYGVKAGTAEWVLLLNADIVDRGETRAFLEHRAVAGILARHIPETDTFASQYIVLTRPVGDDAVEIMVYRTDGELFYAGRASTGNGGLRFSVASTDRPGAAPTVAQGTLGPDGVALTHIAAGARRREKRQTTDLDPSSLGPAIE